MSVESKDIINDGLKKVPINFVNALTQATPVFLSKNKFPSSPKIFHKVNKSITKKKKLLKLVRISIEPSNLKFT